MNPLEILEKFGITVTMCLFLGYFLYRQSLWVQKDLKKDMEEQAQRLENISIGLINAIKKLQVDTGKELSRLEGSSRTMVLLITKLTGNGLKKK